MLVYVHDEELGSLHIVCLRSISKLGSKNVKQLSPPPSLLAVGVVCVVVGVYLSKATFKVVGSRPRIARGSNYVRRSVDSWLILLMVGISL